MICTNCAPHVPTNTAAGHCTTGDCTRSTSSKNFKLCEKHSVETGCCEACGESLEPKSKKRRGGSPLNIAPGGCLGDQVMREAAMRYFWQMFATRDVVFKPTEIIVTVAGKRSDYVEDIRTVFWRRTVRYVFKGDPQPEPTEKSNGNAVAWVRVIFARGTDEAERARLVKRIAQWDGVVKVEKLFPDETSDEALQRFYVVALSSKQREFAVTSDLNDLKAVENASPTVKKNLH